MKATGKFYIHKEGEEPEYLGEAEVEIEIEHTITERQAPSAKQVIEQLTTFTDICQQMRSDLDHIIKALEDEIASPIPKSDFDEAEAALDQACRALDLRDVIKDCMK
ncbi:MAG TPA: hypothetical protein VEF04_09220 [Blastocatellia bacterium]|nr:hypothetical protein [Blastocatellia bacterium]